MPVLCLNSLDHQRTSTVTPVMCGFWRMNREVRDLALWSPGPSPASMIDTFRLLRHGRVRKYRWAGTAKRPSARATRIVAPRTTGPRHRVARRASDGPLNGPTMIAMYCARAEPHMARAQTCISEGFSVDAHDEALEVAIRNQ